MEKPLEKHLEEVAGSPGVSGAMCMDSQGLCLHAVGSTNQASAGLVASLTQQAAKLHPGQKEQPIICLETDTGILLAKSQDGIVTAVYKSAS